LLGAKFSLAVGGEKQMARMLSPGEIVNGYKIEKKLHTGAMAVAYMARNSSGERVFFKQYKSPSVLVPWYKAYVDYQQELKRRIERGMTKNFTYRFVEFFEAIAGPQTFFQVFEFVESGNDLEFMLQKSGSSLAWEQRVTLAKVIMAGVNSLHKSNIVHCDLKPPNIQLFKDDSITAGYRLKLIDMDFSILEDRKAPWHGQEGYVGSPNYFSPEHLKGEVPKPASDVFTCGLILYELLAQGHPYASEDEDAYKSGVLNRSAHKPKLDGKMPGDADVTEVEDYIYRCLSTNAAERPTAEEVLSALNGKGRKHPLPPHSEPLPVPEKKKEGHPKEEVFAVGPIELHATNGKMLHANVDVVIGKRLCHDFGEDAKFLDECQMKIVRVEKSGWFVEPNLKAANETILNGKSVVVRTPLRSGDVLGVGRESRKIIKLPMTVQVKSV
jgi:eukaryotic-like serine/threonine-protein kinase